MKSYGVLRLGFIVLIFNLLAQVLHAQPTKPLVVAVIDDGFLLTHESIKDFIFNNNKENPFNQQDNDANGYIGDYSGYDISDSDNDPQPIDQNLPDFYHGTFIAGTICQLANQYLGESASQLIKILPVKVVSDTGDPNRILDGYQGIEYAIAAGADIIVTAWSGGTVEEDQSAIVRIALSKNILILASAGNGATEKPSPPASISGVVAIGALDQKGDKMYMSNYGQHVDFCSAGEDYQVPSTDCDNCYREGRNTSLATAISAALAAIIKAKKPNLSNHEVIAIMKNSADPLVNVKPKYQGKMGSGQLNFATAIKMVETENFDSINESLPEGVILYDRSKSETRSSWTIRPDFEFAETQFRVEMLEPFDQNLIIFVKRNGELLKSWKGVDVTKEMKVAGTNVEVAVVSSPGTKLFLGYESFNIDSTNYYCQELEAIQGISGSFDDGSGGANYVNETNCKWLITAPEGYRIQLNFDQFDTESKTDFVYIFDGESTQQTNMLARFSGPNFPPTVHSYTNKMLVWFVSNDNITGHGWRGKFIAEPMAQD